MTQEELDKKALELYPIKTYPIQCKDFNRVETVDLNEVARKAYMSGYEDCMMELLETTKKTGKDYFESGRNIGKMEILKNLPKWRTASDDIFSDTLDYIVKYKHDGGDYEDWESPIVTNRVLKGEEYLEICDLINLGKEGI